MRLKVLLVSIALLVVAVVLQTTFFSRFRFVTPDLVLLLAILFAVTEMRREGVLVMAFLGGLVVDLLGATVLGLRAAVFTVIAYVAIRTVHRIDFGPVAVAVWVGLLTIVSVVLFLIVGTLFGEGGVIVTGIGRRVVFVPISNLMLSFLVAPMLNRLMRGQLRGVL